MLDDPEQAKAIAARAAPLIGGLFLAGPVIIGAVVVIGRARGGAQADRARDATLWVRYATFVAINVALLVPAYLGELPFAIVVATIVAAGLAELWRLLEAMAIRPFRIAGWLVSLLLVAVAAGFGPDAVGVALGVVLAAGLPLMGIAAARSGDVKAFVSRAGGTLLGIAAIGLLGSFLVLLRRSPTGFGDVLFFFAAVQFADVFGLLGGLAVGRRPLAPSISPKKTWGGTVASLVAACGGAALFSFAVPSLPIERAVALGGALAVTATLGGLFASAIKRAAGVKDFGRLLPGHGGILDRFDSALFSAPVAWVALRIVI